jgi:hypothetical protein
MDERARKRKLEEIDESDFEIDGVVKETPKQGLRTPKQQTKKQKKELETPLASKSSTPKEKLDADSDSAKKAKSEQKREKQERRSW